MWGITFPFSVTLPVSLAPQNTKYVHIIQFFGSFTPCLPALSTFNSTSHIHQPLLFFFHLLPTFFSKPPHFSPLSLSTNAYNFNLLNTYVCNLQSHINYKVMHAFSISHNNLLHQCCVSYKDHTMRVN